MIKPTLSSTSKDEEAGEKVDLEEEEEEEEEDSSQDAAVGEPARAEATGEMDSTHTDITHRDVEAGQVRKADFSRIGDCLVDRTSARSKHRGTGFRVPEYASMEDLDVAW